MKRLPVFLLIVFLSAVTGCTMRQPDKGSSLPPAKYKVAILYPSGTDTAFDMDYYEKKHMPFVAGYLGKNLEHYEIDKGIAGRTPSDKVPFVAIGYFYVYDVAEYNKAISQNIDTMGDIKKYTQIQPTIQISEIRKGARDGSESGSGSEG